MIPHPHDIASLGSHIEGLVFDFDGVLADSDDLHWQAYRSAFEPYGIPFTREDWLERAKGRGRQEVVAMFGESLDPMERAEVVQLKCQAAQRLVGEGLLKPVEGAIAFIRSAASRGLLSAVASTSEVAGPALDSMGMTALFACICAKRSGDRPKPHPDVFLGAFAGLGRFAEQCLVIEDTPMGVHAARVVDAPVVVRGRLEDWRDPDLAREVSSFFPDFATLHAELGWGPLDLDE